MHLVCANTICGLNHEWRKPALFFFKLFEYFQTLCTLNNPGIQAELQKKSCRMRSSTLSKTSVLVSCLYGYAKYIILLSKKKKNTKRSRFICDQHIHWEGKVFDIPKQELCFTQNSIGLTKSVQCVLFLCI